MGCCAACDIVECYTTAFATGQCYKSYICQRANCAKPQLCRLLAMRRSSMKVMLKNKLYIMYVVILVCSLHCSATQLLKMRLSLSPKEVTEIHLMLTTLPIPPIPVAVCINVDALEDGEVKTAFEMATTSIVHDSLQDDSIVNSHSVFAAMSLFAKWSASTSTSEVKEDMQHKKDASLLRIIASVLDYNESAHVTARDDSKKDDDILQVFITASQEWIDTYLPENISVTITAAPKNKLIGFEHDLHIAMSHYCYSQGVLYNSKKSSLMCAVHDGLFNEFLSQSKQAVEDADDDDDDGKAQHSYEHMEIAAMYSRFPYHKLMLLCFDRLLRDCLYGHKPHNADPNVHQNARELLKMSFANYQAMTHKTVSAETTQIANTSARVESSPPVTHIANTVTFDAIATTVNTKKPIFSGEIEATSAAPAKTACFADMGSYKSSIGIFILGFVNFLKKDDPYFLQNMHTSLRHLHELLSDGNDMAKQACQLIDLPKLVLLVRTNFVGLSNTGTVHEIETILFQLEKMTTVTTLPTSELAVAGLIDNALVFSASLDPCPIVEGVALESLSIADPVVHTGPALDCLKTPLQDSSIETAGIVFTCANRPESHLTNPPDPAATPIPETEARE